MDNTIYDADATKALERLSRITENVTEMPLAKVRFGVTNDERCYLSRLKRRRAANKIARAARKRNRK